MSRPNWMIETVIAGLQGLVAELEIIATSNSLDPVKAAAVSTAIATGPALSRAVAAPTAPSRPSRPGSSASTTRSPSWSPA